MSFVMVIAMFLIAGCADDTRTRGLKVVKGWSASKASPNLIGQRHQKVGPSVERENTQQHDQRTGVGQQPGAI
jgi:hypothetical protein